MSLRPSLYIIAEIKLQHPISLLDFSNEEEDMQSQNSSLTGPLEMTSTLTLRRTEAQKSEGAGPETQ